ncbi:MAG TPA: protein phosphatase 2C domain-containing protein [Vicinamibacterales bacterium]|nr:protein phosphatase 2C domain-containing protein [Vicinamibacterales bacterium]
MDAPVIATATLDRTPAADPTTHPVAMPSPPPLEVKAFGITDPGRVRQSNEDHFLIAELTKTMRIWHTSLPDPAPLFGNERGHLFLVADGMGGHKVGETASALAVAAIEQFTLNTFKWFFHSDEPETQRAMVQFQEALHNADDRVIAESSAHPELSGMGTTMTLAYHLDAQLCVVHVGDSRAYLFKDDCLCQITHDHSVTADMVRRGVLRPEDVAKHFLRHVITNVVGGNEAGITVEAHAMKVSVGDRLLLCSDGLTEMLTNEAIAAILRAEPDPEAACGRLVAQANDGGGRDNITAVIVRFDPAVREPASH